MSTADVLAPCIVVVGPPNSGKSSLVDRLDRALQHHADRPEAYVIKGSPDGTGHYLLHAPALRQALKDDVKGGWSARTPEIIVSWIRKCRRHLDVVLVDLGGKHDPVNQQIFEQCTHYIALARREDPDGLSSWARACEESGLEPVARLQSVLAPEQPAFDATGCIFEGTFRGDAGWPEDPNHAVLDGLVERILALRVDRPPPTYLDLRQPRDWHESDLPDIGGRAAALATMAESGRVVLGGSAPIWAYAAAMHRALDIEPQVDVQVFDPKLSRPISIPAHVAPDCEHPIAAVLSVEWVPCADSTALRLKINSPEKWLDPGASDDLGRVPLPQGTFPAGPVWTYGKAPIWLHLTYIRWVRSHSRHPSVGVWDARTERVIFPTGSFPRPPLLP